VKHDDEDVCQQEVFQIFVEILCGLEYLHLLGLPYGLLTPRNIYKRALQNQVFVPSLFPLTKDYVDLVDDRCPGLVPPEFLNTKWETLKRAKKSFEADIFCLGSILFYLIEGVYPNEDEFLFYEQEIYEEWKYLIDQMRSEYPEKRPTFDQIFDHKIFDIMGKESGLDFRAKRKKVRTAAGVKMRIPTQEQDPISRLEMQLRTVDKSLRNAEKVLSRNRNDFSTRDNSPECTVLDIKLNETKHAEDKKQFVKQRSLMLKDVKSTKNELVANNELSSRKKIGVIGKTSSDHKKL
jgi:serine/threonine protein kinase